MFVSLAKHETRDSALRSSIVAGDKVVVLDMGTDKKHGAATCFVAEQRDGKFVLEPEVCFDMRT